MADGSQQADEANRRLEELRATLNREIRRLLSRLDTKRGSAQLESDREALATASRVRQQVLRVLEEQGYLAYEGATEKAAADAADAVASTIDLGEFSPEMSTTIEQLVSGQLDDVAAVFDDAAEKVAEAMRRGVATGASLDDLIDEVAGIVDASARQAQSAVDSAIMGAGRRTTIEATAEAQDESGEEWGLRYIGPRDRKTRPWCSKYLGKVVRVGDVESLDNGTDLQASDFGGGYNCRHSWAPIRLSEAREKGYKVL